MFKSLKRSLINHQRQPSVESQSLASIQLGPLSDFITMILKPTQEFKQFYQGCGFTNRMLFLEQALKLEKTVMEIRIKSGYKPIKKDNYPSLTRFTINFTGGDPVDDYDKMDIPVTIVSDFLKLYKQFLQKNSKSNVGLYDTTREAIEDEFKAGNMLKFKASIFDEAIAEVIMAVKKMYSEIYLTRFGSAPDLDSKASLTSLEKLSMCDVEEAFVVSISRGKEDFQLYCEGKNMKLAYRFLNSCLILESQALELRIGGGFLPMCLDLPTIERFNKNVGRSSTVEVDVFVVANKLFGAYMEVYDSFVKNEELHTGVPEDVIKAIQENIASFEEETALCVISSNMDLRVVEDTFSTSPLSKVDTDLLGDINSYISAKNASARVPMSNVFDELIDFKIGELYDLFKVFHAISMKDSSTPKTVFENMKDFESQPLCPEFRFIESLLSTQDTFKLQCAVLFS